MRSTGLAKHAAASTAIETVALAPSRRAAKEPSWN